MPQQQAEGHQHSPMRQEWPPACASDRRQASGMHQERHQMTSVLLQLMAVHMRMLVTCGRLLTHAVTGCRQMAHASNRLLVNGTCQ